MRVDPNSLDLLPDDLRDEASRWDLLVGSSEQVRSAATKVIVMTDRTRQLNPDSVIKLGYQLAGQLRECAAADSGAPRVSWQYLQFLVTISPLLTATGMRRFDEAFDLVSFGMSDGHEPGTGNVEPRRLLQFLAHHAIPQRHVLDDIVCWGMGFWYLAWAYATYREPARELLGLFQNFSAQLGRSPSREVVNCYSHICEWAVDNEMHADALDTLASPLRNAISESGDESARLDAATALQGRVGRALGYPRSAVASLARSHPSAMIRLQVVVGDWLEGSTAATSEIMRESRDLHIELDSFTSTGPAREVFFRVLHPVVFQLASQARLDDLLELLALWSRPRDSGPPRRIRVWVPWADGGSLLVGADGSVRAGRACDLDDFTRSYNRFTHGSITIRGITHEPDRPASPVGLVTDDRGADHERLLMDLVEAAFQDQPHGEAFTLAPAELHPVQAIQRKLFRAASPYSVSIRPPLADRTIRRATIVAADDMMEALEVSEVSRLLSADHVNVTHVPVAAATTETLRAAWEDADVDLLWFVGHGDLDGYSPRQAHLLVGGEAVLFSDIAQWTTPINERRLLVVNACFGATAARLEGMGGMGLGPAVAGASQAVISQLWNAHWLAAPIFGILLASELSEAGFFSAFDQALGVFTSGRQGILERLEAIGAGGAVERVRNNDSVDWSDLAIWGSPAFLE